MTISRRSLTPWTYRQLIAKADERFDDHLSRLKKDTRK